MAEAINVAEQFYSIQGEGPYAGTPAVFLRLTGCNLVCGGRENLTVESQDDMEPRGGASWVCDTISVWREASETYTPDELVDEWAARGWLESVVNGEAHVVLTGGEPLLEQNQAAVTPFLRELDDRAAGRAFIEVETNGTRVPHPEFETFVDHYNVSVKLENSGMEVSDRIVPEAIRHFSHLTANGVNAPASAKFKFVVGDDSDVDEIQSIVRAFFLDGDMVSLMPAGASLDDVRETYPVVAELCKEHGWDFTPRLQVDVWNQATGV